MAFGGKGPAKGFVPIGVANSSGRVNSMGMNRRDLEELLDTLDALDAENAIKSNRKYVRRQFRQLSVPLQISHATGVSLTNVCTRNISRTGVSVLHSAFMHTGTACQIILPRVDGKPLPVKAKVVRCIHRRGTVHELGLRFDKTIDTKQLVASGLFSDWFSLEHVVPEDLNGSLLYVEDSETDRHVIRHHLSDTNMSVTVAKTAAEGLSRAMDGFELIMVDYHLSDMDGAKFIQELRESGVQTPVILVTSDLTSATPQRMSGVNAQAYLAKPIGRELLHRAIAEFLQVEGCKSGLTFASTLPANHPNASMVEYFVSDLHRLTEAITAAVDGNDLETCRNKIGKIKGTAASMGFAAIGDMAERALTSLTASQSVEESSPQITRLIAACKRAYSRQSA